MTIKHLVITGGGPYGFYSFGVLSQLKQKGVFHLENIESIYASSIGCLVGILMVLKNISHDEVVQYIINKQFLEFLKLTPDHIFNMYSKKGVYDIVALIKNLVEPIFYSENVSPTITIKEFYEHYNVKLNFMTTNINDDFSEYCISLETQPDLPVYKAVAASMSIPFIFYPINIGDMCLVDGGAVSNYPVHVCMKDYPDNEENILGVYNKYNKDKTAIIVNQESSILTYTSAFVYQLMKNLDMAYKPTDLSPIKHDIAINISGGCGILNKDVMTELLTDKDKRYALIKDGYLLADEYLKTIKYFDEAEQDEAEQDEAEQDEAEQDEAKQDESD